MLAIADQDQQPPVIEAIFAAAAELGNEPDEHRVTTGLLTRLIAAGGTADDVVDLMAEGAVQPWAIHVWPVLAGAPRPVAVAEPSSPALSAPPEPLAHRPHPAELQTGQIPVMSPADVAEAALADDLLEPDRSTAPTETIARAQIVLAAADAEHAKLEEQPKPKRSRKR